MIKRLSKTPKSWLTLNDCAHLFKDFKKRLEFDEPIPPFNTRYPSKLEGILNSVKQTYAKKYLNPTILEAAAAYFNQIIRGHPFKNGNKRMAVLYTHFFLLINKVDFTLSPWEMYNFAMAVAIAGQNSITAEETKDWCKQVIAKFTRETE